MCITKIRNLLRQLYYGLFGRYVLYPLMNVLPKKTGIKFMNLGYIPKNWSFPAKDGDDDETVIDIIRKNLEPDDSTLPHCFLYEKTLSFYPNYPKFSNKILLEVGCGLGGGIEWLKRAHPELEKIVGLDKVVAHSNSKEFIQGEAENLPFPRATFDVVLNVESSHLYASMTKFFEEVRRVLKPGGYLCWADLRLKGQMELLLESAESEGLNLVHFKIVTPQILRGLDHTSARYDKLLTEAPWYIKLFKASLRETYCAPGTKTYEQYRSGEKQYAIACWKKPKY